MAILILGATSEIALENAKLFAARGEKLILAARAPERLAESLADPLEGLVHFEAVRTVPCSAETELRDFSSASAFWTQCTELAQNTWGEELRGIYAAQGFLHSGDRKQWGEELEATFFVNLTSVAFFLEAAALWFEAHPESAKGAWIAVLSSVAGERGRYSNYPYGAAKAGLTAYLSGLRARLFPLGVSVLTVKPGLVKTRMIAKRPQGRSLSAADPQKVARQIDRAIFRRQSVLYTPSWWRFVMFCVRSIPESLFKRMKF
ncbi:MAG: SDR family NAD(P)-dependent oxidoreductase [Planctomycetaceae bacterium]|nr:SDR family NAD(P)-dependent oxidoreductase [Planctomycetaceae bacterium]